MRTISIYKSDELCYAGLERHSTSDAMNGTSMRSFLVSCRAVVLAFAVLATPAVLAADDVASFKLVARDGVFEPATVEVPAGKRFRLEVSNEGKSAMEFESRELKQEKIIAPGKKATLSINALKAGEYKFVDEFHEKTGQGKVVAK